MWSNVFICSLYATYACGGEVSVWSVSRMFSYVRCMLLMHVEKYPCGLCLCFHMFAVCYCLSVWSMSRMFSYVLYATYACEVEVSVWSMSRMFSYVRCMLLIHVK